MESQERPGEYIPAGEERGVEATFTVDQVAMAFDVELDRVSRAMTGEFGRDDVQIDSKMAQHLAEVLLGDQPQDQQMAALMTLGAFTPRPDHDWGLGEKDPAEESDKLARDKDELDRD